MTNHIEIGTRGVQYSTTGNGYTVINLSAPLTSSTTLTRVVVDMGAGVAACKIALFTKSGTTFTPISVSAALTLATGRQVITGLSLQPNGSQCYIGIWIPAGGSISRTNTGAGVHLATGDKTGGAFDFGAATATREALLYADIPTNYYVDSIAGHGGSDSNTGLETNAAFLTLGKAKDWCLHGDTVYCQGTFNEALFFSGVKATHTGTPVYLTFKGYNGVTPVIDGNGINLTSSPKALIHVYLSEYLDIEDFEMKRAGNTGKGCAIFGSFDDTLNGSSPWGHFIFKNLNIHDCYGTGFVFGGIHGSQPTAGRYIDTMLIDNCRVHDISTTTGNYDDAFDGPAISLTYIYHLEIKNCTIYNNGMAMADWTGVEGIVVRIGSSDVKIHDNEIYNCRVGIYPQSQWISQTGFDIYNNKIHNCYDAGIAFACESGVGLSQLDTDVYNNLVYSNGGFLGHSTIGDTNEGNRVYGGGGIIVMAYSFTKTIRIINNTLFDNHKEEIANLDSAGTNTACVIQNNLVLNLQNDSWAVRLVAGGVTGWTIDRNLFRNTGGSWNGSNNYLGTNYTTEDPLFTTVGSYAGSPTATNAASSTYFRSGVNLMIQAGSPCTDAGVSTAAPVTDYNDVARPQGLTFDLGAYELVITTPANSYLKHNETLVEDDILAKDEYLSQDNHVIAGQVIGDIMYFDGVGWTRANLDTLILALGYTKA